MPPKKGSSKKVIASNILREQKNHHKAMKLIALKEFVLEIN